MRNNKTFIIAEAGVNHNGSIILAKKLIDIAKKSGADAVKFQAYKADELSLPSANKAAYQKKFFPKESQYEMLKKYELKEIDYKKLKSYCIKKKIHFMLSVFDLASLAVIKRLKLKYIKIPSGEITNYPLLEKISKLKKKIILSTGMSNFNEIKNAIKILKKGGLRSKSLIILHCTSSYPAPDQEVNLRALTSIKKKFNLEIGYSDHTINSDTCLAAVTLGARYIEKHLTLNKKLFGPDHSASASPQEFKSLIKRIRKLEILMGSPKKIVTQQERQNINLVRKSIVARTNIKKGQKLTDKLITTKRPCYGLSSDKWYKYLGTKAKKNYKLNDFI